MEDGVVGKGLDDLMFDCFGVEPESLAKFGKREEGGGRPRESTADHISKSVELLAD